ncbi:MAG: HEAT repeat domain-containing protein [Planctomycetaceae bacterium]
MPRIFPASCRTLFLVATLLTAGMTTAEETGAKTREQELLAVLRTETPEADKALAFKGLAVHGTSACVADVATYLGNERLSSWARIALEAIPGAEATAALRAAAAPGTALASRQLVGVINSLGVRRDEAAVPLVAARLGDRDPNVAAAAAAALGKIGTGACAAALAPSLAAGTPDRDAVAEGCVMCGERLAAAGDVPAAIALFEAVRGADVAEQRRAEASRAAILARGRAGLPLLVDLLRSPSQRLFTMGLFTARELAGGPDRDAALAYEVDLALLKTVSGTGPLPGGRAALILDLLADRNAGGAGKAVQQALMEAAAAGEPSVRLAAIRAVGRCGDAAAADRLLDVGETGDAAVVAAVRQALATMPAEGVDERIVARLDSAPAVLRLAVGLIGDRRIVSASGRVQPLADHPDPAVRSAAIAALGSIVDLSDLGSLVRRAAAPRDDAEGAAAASALKEAAVRMADRDGCAAVIAAAIGSAGDRAGVLVETLAEVGGATALAAVAAAAESGDQSLQDAATRVLGKWMTADAAPVLLDLATTDKAGPYRGRAFKGYVRIARQFALPEPERAEMCRRALAAAEDAGDRKAVVEILVRYPHDATLTVAREAVSLPDVADEARAAVAAIETKLAKPAGTN